MNDTQSASEDHPSTTEDDPLTMLAGVDPAEAPPVAERYAADLEARLESADGPPQTDTGAVTER